MEVIQYPDSPFKLHQPFPPAGDQPTAIAGLLEGLSDGLAYQTLLGVTGSGKTYTMANVIAQTAAPPIIMAHNKTLAAQLYAEMREFSPKTRWNISSPTTTITTRSLCAQPRLVHRERQRD